MEQCSVLWRCGAVICSFSAVALWVPVQRCGAVALWEHATAPQHLTLCFCAVGCSGCPFSAVALWGARSALWRCGCPFSAVALCFARSALWRCGAVKRRHSATALNTAGALLRCVANSGPAAHRPQAWHGWGPAAGHRGNRCGATQPMQRGTRATAGGPGR